MKEEIDAAGLQAHFVAVNAVSAKSEQHQQKLIDKCAYPLLQDTDEADVWGLHEGGKDDFYLFDATGKLIVHLPFGGEMNTNLSTDEGYGNLKGLILDAIADQ